MWWLECTFRMGSDASSGSNMTDLEQTLKDPLNLLGTIKRKVIVLIYWYIPGIFCFKRSKE